MPKVLRYVFGIIALCFSLIAVRGVAVPAAPLDGLDLKQNYPNPFTASTEIGYKLPAPGRVLIRIFNTIGQEVTVLVNEEKQPGDYIARFEGGNYPSGQYTYTMVFTQTDNGSVVKLTRRMYLVR